VKCFQSDTSASFVYQNNFSYALLFPPLENFLVSSECSIKEVSLHHLAYWLHFLFWNLTCLHFVPLHMQLFLYTLLKPNHIFPRRLYDIIIFFCISYQYLASREDVATTPVYVRFNRYQRKAVGTIKIFSDDIIEGVETFAVKMTLPSSGPYKRLLSYKHPRHTYVYIRDCKCEFLNLSFVCKLFVIAANFYACNRIHVTTPKPYF